MESTIKKTKIGKLRIYLKAGETVKGDRFFHKIFPRNKYNKMLDEARKSGIRNAHICHTHAAYEKGGEVHHHHLETSIAGLTVCLELVDEKEKLELFFKTHQSLLNDRTVIYKEVERWE